MANKKISQLDAASSVNSDAVFPLSQLVNGTETTQKGTVGQVGSYIAGTQTYNSLNTTSKTVVGAINELQAGGGGGGTSNYNDLTNKPQVNSVTLSGDKTSSDLKVIWKGTQAQYDAIVTKDPETIYFITDTNGPSCTATDVTYDPSSSDLSSTTVQTALNELSDEKADETDLASIHITGSTNNTGSTINSGTYFYLYTYLVRAKTDIANGATLTVNTNYEVVTAGGLNSLASNKSKVDSFTVDVTTTNDGLAAVTLPSGVAINNCMSVVVQNSSGVYLYAFLIKQPSYLWVDVRQFNGSAYAAQNCTVRIFYYS